MDCSFSLAKLSASIGAAILLGASSMASAALVNGSDFASASGNTHFTGPALNPDFKWEIAPNTLTFKTKTMGTYTGVGISGTPTTDEIDIGEFLTGTSVNNLFSVFSLQLGVLFDGPEFNDVNEVAQVTATRRNGTSIVHTLRATGTTTAIWSGTTSTSGAVSNKSPADNLGGGAVWEIMNPFGNINDFTKISFTALRGTCGGAPAPTSPTSRWSN
jgi:hypothetical protein